ncbi:EAL domain-containing protein [Kosakonia sacchari]|uniref:EAL domain-containing protein n=1 Tax=Kosakonia sacchari TaxID=1158459 RepID=UPI00158580AF|nr:EAL domain-containing protein [Kosakonia sacchari]NUL35224.1 EAL domain-containing protein [Kosakonia sacchari]
MIKVLKKGVSIYIAALLLSFAFFYIVAQVAYYAFIQEKVEDYAESILARSDNIILQVREINALREEFSVYTPCSDPYLHALRKRLWPYPLIKDIGYVEDGRIICSALWGKYAAPLSLNVFKNKVSRGSYTWVFDALIENNITADVVYNNNFSVTVSPFAFTRFREDSTRWGFNAVVGDYNHKQHFFRVGNNTSLLENIEHGKVHEFFFITEKSCDAQHDICVVAGVRHSFVFNNNGYILLFLFCVASLVGLFVGALISKNQHENQSLLTRLENAIINKELHFVYQPLYRVKDKSIIGVEVLLRWNDKQMGNIGPDIFIPLAEENGLINKISLYVVEHAIKECGAALREKDITLSINVSCSDICSKTFYQRLIDTLQQEGVAGKHIMLEITERQSGRIEDIMQSICLYKEHGVLFALDDFGTGYSNLKWLSMLDVDEIKIDKSITDSIGTQSINRHILPGLIAMFKDMPRTIVFEGVENEAQHLFLQGNLPESCAQGWYFSKALAFSEIENLLAQVKQIDEGDDSNDAMLTPEQRNGSVA